MFTSGHGGMINSATSTGISRPSSRCAGLLKIRFHGLRYSCAPLLLDQDAYIVVIKELLGHAHIAIAADNYAHVQLPLQGDATESMATPSTTTAKRSRQKTIRTFVPTGRPNPLRPVRRHVVHESTYPTKKQVLPWARQ
ncbi:tyrosine-type recombinase/integrase [Nonomuraea aurantiaca]|uniref:tyrosine-type recombinase/integrase n=1 Tax=Nonomuraea aurantiaca TaxID=2878562 RepID=UPI001CD9F2A8|nr:tyrosine-type recombinase/integrase [Nonomuraea aurantiaca]